MALTSGTGLAALSPLAKRLALVDGEFIAITGLVDSPTVDIARGNLGTLAAAHAVLTPVIFGAPSDFAYQGTAPVVSYGVSGAIAIPTVNTVIYLTKATAAVMTLAAPPLDCTAEVTIMSLTAAAHTVTYTPGFYGDTTGSDVATFTAGIGAFFKIRVANGSWGGIDTGGVSIG
jgi:hypothetical protein